MHGIFTDKEEDDGGMRMNEFRQGFCITKMKRLASEEQTVLPPMDPTEWERLTNSQNGMFKKWADPSNTSAIARFMREELDPRKIYSKRDLTERWRRFSKESLDKLMRKKIGISNGYGIILVKEEGGRIRLHPRLVPMFEAYF